MTLQLMRHQLDVSTGGRGFTRLDGLLNQWLVSTGVQEGALHLTCLHTSASLTINENADPRVLQDLASWMDRIVPRDHPYRHDDEGPDDMPAHIKASTLGSSVSIPITDGRLALGTWQGIYLGEHRNHGGSRKVVATVYGQTR